MPYAPWKLHWYSQTAWDAMLDACRGAKKSIRFEQFAFESFKEGEIGYQFAELFAQKAKEGVLVRVLVDSIGSAELLMSRALALMTKAGVQVEWNTIGAPWRPLRFLLHLVRNHRKLLVVDTETAFVGGVIINERARLWRDTHIMLSGPIVKELKFAFNDLWHGVRGKDESLLDVPGERHDGFEVAVNTPGITHRRIRNDLVGKVRRARQRVWITTPYFSPDRGLLRMLKHAARRGVDTRILLPKSSDQVAADIAARSYFASLLHSGIRLFLYQGEILHAKTAVVDDVWATVGSANLDPLSLYYNHELNVHTVRKDVIAALGDRFLKDMEHAEEVVVSKWQLRPWYEKWLEGTVGMLLRKFV